MEVESQLVMAKNEEELGRKHLAQKYEIYDYLSIWYFVLDMYLLAKCSNYLESNRGNYV